MKHKNNHLIIALIVTIVFVPAVLQAQYKSEALTIPGLSAARTNSPISIFGLDLSKIEFDNSYSMSVGSFGGNTVATGLIKSSFNYTINPQVTVRGYVGLVHSPFSSFSPTDQQSSFINGITKDNVVYGGEVTYKPKENVSFHIGISRIPYNPYKQLYSNYPFSARGY